MSGLMDTLRDDRLGGAPVRRAAQGPRQQVRPRPVRAVGLHRQPGDPDRQVDRGLHLPLARLALPVARGQGQPRPPRPGRRIDEAPSAPSGHPFAAGVPRWPPPCGARRDTGAGQRAVPAVEPVTTDESDTPKATGRRRVAAPAAEPWRSSPPTAHCQRSRGQRQRAKATNGNGGGAAPITLNLGATKVSFQTQADAPSCADCGSIMVRNGSLLQVPQLREHQRLQLSSAQYETRPGHLTGPFRSQAPVGSPAIRWGRGKLAGRGPTSHLPRRRAAAPEARTAERLEPAGALVDRYRATDGGPMSAGVT